MVRNINVPLFGMGASGKTYFVAALCYWMVSKNFAKIVDGEAYANSIIDTWKLGNNTPQTNPGQHHPITLEIEPTVLAALTHDLLQRQRLRVTMYDLSGEDYIGKAPKANRGMLQQMYHKHVERGLPEQRPSDYFIEHITKADAAIAMIDLARTRRRVLKPKRAEKAKTKLYYCGEDGSRMRYDSETGFYTCQNKHEIIDARLELMLDMPNKHCRADSTPMEFDDSRDGYNCDNCNTFYARSEFGIAVPPGRLNWTNETLSDVLEQGNYLNNALHTLWQTSSFMTKWNKHKLPIIIGISKHDLFNFISAEKLSDLINAYCPILGQNIGHDNYKIIPITAHGNVRDRTESGPQPDTRTFAEMLKYILCKSVI